METQLSRESSLPDYVDVGSGKPIIMLPGMDGAKEFWRNQWEELGNHYRVIACSHMRRKLSLSRKIADYAADVLQLMDELELERAVVVGESFGGMVAQELAIEHPARLAALILCNTMHKPRLEHVGINWFTIASMVQPLAFVVPNRYRIPIFNWVGKHRGSILDPSPANDKLAEYLLEHGLEPGLFGYLNRILAGTRTNYSKKLPSIAMPTLVLRGAEDRLVGIKTITELVGLIPNAELVLIDGGGHCCQFTIPIESNRAITEWLARIGYN